LLKKEAIMMAEREFECIQHQLASLRRENRFLKGGLILCFVFAALPYLAGFQPETISAKRVVTERIEFVRDGKTVMSFTLHPKSDGLVIWYRDELPAIWITREKNGGLIGIYNKDGKIVADMAALPIGGRVEVCNNDSKTVASMDAGSYGRLVSVNNNDTIPVALMGVLQHGGSVWVCDSKGNTLASMDATLICGTLELKTPSGQTVWSAP
jgi:hypothetical protein